VLRQPHVLAQLGTVGLSHDTCDAVGVLRNPCALQTAKSYAARRCCATSGPNAMHSHAVIFDLDGLLADTELLHAQAYVAALHEVGVTLSKEDYEEHWIRKGLGIAELCLARELTIDPLAARARKLALYETLVRSRVEPMPGAHEGVAALRPNYALAVGTSSKRQSALLVLDSLGFEFSVVVTASDVTRLKPSPDIFIEAARRLNVHANNCVVVEDAEKGVVAAAAAGMKCIAVPNRHTSKHDFSLATRVISNLTELTPKIVAEVFGLMT
jgi:HAD superfamily hydrolase (TIGR01509 family)